MGRRVQSEKDAEVNLRCLPAKQFDGHKSQPKLGPPEERCQTKPDGSPKRLAAFEVGDGKLAQVSSQMEFKRRVMEVDDTSSNSEAHGVQKERSWGHRNLPCSGDGGASAKGPEHRL